MDAKTVASEQTSEGRPRTFRAKSRYCHLPISDAPAGARRSAPQRELRAHLRSLPSGRDATTYAGRGAPSGGRVSPGRRRSGWGAGREPRRWQVAVARSPRAAQIRDRRCATGGGQGSNAEDKRAKAGDSAGYSACADVGPATQPRASLFSLDFHAHSSAAAQVQCMAFSQARVGRC